MNILNDNLRLAEIERILISQMHDEKRDCRIIGDLVLSKEDYSLLVCKLKSLMENRENLIALEEFKFSLVTALVFALSYEEIKKIDSSYISYVLYQYPQHHEKYIIRAFEWAFDEYCINTYGIRISTISDVLELMVLHIGIPHQFHNSYFELVERSFHFGGLHPENTVSENIPQYLQNIFGCVNIERRHYLTRTSREIYYDYKNGLSQDEITKKYSWYPLLLMRACFDYCDGHTKE